MKINKYFVIKLHFSFSNEISQKNLWLIYSFYFVAAGLTEMAKA